MISNQDEKPDKGKLHETIGTKEYGEGTIELAYYEIERITEELENANNVDQVAKAVYRRSLDHRLVEWNSIRELAAASVLSACRTQKTPYSPKEISEISNISQKKLTNTFAAVKSQLDLEVGPIDPRDYVPRYVKELDKSKRVEKTAIEVLDICSDHGLISGKSPSAYAASAVYISSLINNEKLTQKEVARVAGVNIKTIRKRYQEQAEDTGILEDIK